MVWSLGLKDPWRRAWWPTPVFLPGESQGHRSLAGCEVAESNSTEVTGYACLLARRGKQWIIAREGKNVNIVTSGPCLCHRLGGLLSLGSVAIFHLELGLGWGIALLCPLEHVTTRNSLSILSVLPLPLFFLLFSSPDTISWDNPFIYAFFYSANAYEVRESYTLLVSALYLKSQEKCDVIYRHVVIDTDESFFFFVFDVGHFKNLEFVTILLPFYVLFFFGLQACGILAPEQGCNLYTLCWKVKS